MFSPSAIPLSDPQTFLPLIQATPVAAPSPSGSSSSNLQLPSSDDSSSGGLSNRSESIGNSTTCQPPDKPPVDSKYYPSREKHLQFCIHVNPCFSRYRGDPEVGTSTPIRIVDQTPTRQRNRLKTGSYSLVTLPETKPDESNDEQLDQLEETVDDSCPSVEFKGLAATSNLDVSISTPLSQSSAPSITSDTRNLPIQNKHQKNQDNDHANVLSRLPFTSAQTDGDMIYLDQVLGGTRSLDRKSFDALFSATVSNSDTNVTIYSFEREKVSMAELKPIEIDYFLKSNSLATFSCSNF